MLSGIRFNERIGPGEATTLKSGEDLLYYYEIVKRNRLTEFVELQDSYVLPSRTSGGLFRRNCYTRKGKGPCTVIW